MLGEEILGVMLSAVVLILSCLFIIDNPRVGTEWSILSMFKYDNFGQYVEIVKALLFPPESMALRSFIFESNHSSVDAYKYLDISDSRSNSSPSCMHNLGAIGRFNNVAGFNSNMNGSNFEFYHSIGLERTVSTKIVDDRLNDYLGVKYIVSCYGDEYDEDTYQLEGKYGPYKLYLNDEYREFGFNANKYISSYEFNLLFYDERIDKLGEYVVLSDEQIDKYKDLFTEEVTYNSNDFKFLVNGFSSNIDLTGDTLAIYTVPYDEGWSATNNGSSVERMMAVKIYEGENEIVFSYMTPGLKSGGVISIFALGILGSYIFVNRRKKVK